jgi:hypothetical protein
MQRNQQQIIIIHTNQKNDERDRPGGQDPELGQEMA